MTSRDLPDWPGGRPLRAWQDAAVEAVDRHVGGSFLASATPAAGKTTFGLKVAHEYLRTGRAQRVAVLAPTAHICRQWAQDAARYGIDLEPNRPNAEGPEPADRHGVCVTYQAVAAGSKVHARATAQRRTLLIADEPHHMGEQAAWGRYARDAFDRAAFRLLLSGTPFRSDNEPIPWVSYDEDGVSRADFNYGYTQSLVDRVCRPITFLPYDGDMEWMSGGRQRSHDFGTVLPAQESARRLRTALEPDGDWMAEVLRDADSKLAELRAGSHPAAGGLVVAADKEHARAIAARLTRIAGDEPAIVTSDDPRATHRIAAFSASSDRWLVSVLMVSEGVDIPRLRVGVYATPARTELFFRQVVGRFIRRTPTPAEQMAYLLMPADPRLKELAVRVEEERNHALRLELASEEEPREVAERGEAGEGFAALSSSARLDAAIRPGENLSLFGDDDPAPPPAPKTSRHLEVFGGAMTAPPRTPPPVESRFEKRESARATRSNLVAQLARLTGETHRQVNGRMNRAVGAASVADATARQLDKANQVLAKEISRRSGAHAA